MNRLYAATLLYYLIHGASAFSSSSQFPDQSSNKISSPRSSPLSPVETSTNLTAERRTGRDLFTELIIQKKSKAKPKGRQRVSAAAPVVDSALLRFLSSQKAETKENDVVDEQVKFQQETSWLGQYNQNRVTNLLMEFEVNKMAASKAGEVVQTHVLARTARRRVRDFLRKRDQEWVNGDLLNVEDETTQPKYGLKDIVDLLMDAGLTGNDVAAVLTHTPGVAVMMPRRNQPQADDGETLEETLERAFRGVLIESLKLRKYDARKVVRACPGLLTSKGSKRAENVVTLMTSLGVSVSSLAREKQALPILLSRAPSGIFRLVSFLASDAVRMPVKSIGPLLRRKQSAQLLNLVAPVPGFTDQNSTMMDRIDAEVWSRNVQLRREQINDVYKSMARTAWTLRTEIGTEDLGKVVSAYPSVLLLDAEKQILPTAAYLMNLLDIWEEDLPLVLQLYPFLLGEERDDMDIVVNYLKDLGIEEESLPGIFRAFPALLTMDVEKTMVPVVDFLNEIGIANIGRFISRLPAVLGYSVEDELRPKWEYLSKVCLYPSFELSTFPAYFSYPLDRVIKTRYEYLQFVKKAPTNLLALDLVVRYGDKDFAEQVAKDSDRGRAFAEFSKLRQAVRTEQSRRSKMGGAK